MRLPVTQPQRPLSGIWEPDAEAPVVRDAAVMVRAGIISDEQWERIVRLLPDNTGKRGRPFRDHRQGVEGVLYRLRTGIPWRDLPDEFGPWQTVWKGHARFSRDGTWDQVLAQLLKDADAAQALDWTVSVDSTVARAYQHATNIRRSTGRTPRSRRASRGGPVELQESA